jgi:signal transduction histidine kinase
MVPYRGRLALRIARTMLALSCLAWYWFPAEGRSPWILAGLGAYLIFAAVTLAKVRFDSSRLALIAFIVDAAFFAFWTWAVPAGPMSALVFGFLLAATVVAHNVVRVSIVVTFAAIVALLLVLESNSGGRNALAWTVIASSAVVIALSFHKSYLERRLSHTMRHNVLIRSQAQSAREAERERIAADFHDGPLQSFISFQMRLEILRKLLARDVGAAAEELRQLQELCRAQVSELRSFVRSMRPADDGASLSASLSRMVEQFQRDTSISASFSSGEFHDPDETEVSLEVLQIVREALNNIQKHSGATRIAISISKREERLDISVEDNGAGFSFSGAFTLDELELLRQGPVSIKRRVRMLGGELQLESRPGQGAKLQVRIPL